MNKKLESNSVIELDALAFCLTIITIVSAVITYSIFNAPKYPSQIDIPLLAACTISALYSILILVLCSRVRMTSKRIKKLETMVETLLARTEPPNN